MKQCWFYKKVKKDSVRGE